MAQILLDTPFLITALSAHTGFCPLAFLSLQGMLHPPTQLQLDLCNSPISAISRKHPCVRTVGRKQKVSNSEVGANLDSKLRFFFLKCKAFQFCFVKASPPPHFTPSFSKLSCDLIPVENSQQPQIYVNFFQKRDYYTTQQKRKKVPTGNYPQFTNLIHRQTQTGWQIIVPQNLSLWTSFLSCLKWRKWHIALNLSECWG